MQQQPLEYPIKKKKGKTQLWEDGNEDSIDRDDNANTKETSVLSQFDSHMLARAPPSGSGHKHEMTRHYAA